MVKSPTDLGLDQVRARNRLEASAIPDAEGRKSDAMEFLQKSLAARDAGGFLLGQHGNYGG